MLKPQDALVRLGRSLLETGYSFTTVTPQTHKRMLKRRTAQAVSLRDIFGWSLPFSQDALAPPLWALARDAEILIQDKNLWRSRVRFSSLGHDLYMHSAFPTHTPDAVFFGPDTYRFANLLAARARAAQCVVDVGCGSGAGGLFLRNRVRTVVLADINPMALRVAEVNAQIQQAERVTFFESDILHGVPHAFDMVIANPPYIVDDLQRTYRNGGGNHGIDVALRIVREALARLPRGGQLLLYTGTPVCNGEDVFRTAVQPLLDSRSLTYTYGEMDPDVFGDELDLPAYSHAERLAVVFLDVTVG